MATRPETPAKILVVGWFPPHSYSSHLRGLAEDLARAGFREGRDYAFDYRQTRSQEALDRALAGLAQPPALIYSTNTSPSEFVHRSGTSVPHVFLTYSDPLADGWIASYMRPAGRATGVVEFVAVHDRRLDLLLRLVPGRRNVAVIAEAAAMVDDVTKHTTGFAQARGSLAIHVVRVAPGDSPRALADRLRSLGVQAAYVPLLGEIDQVVDTIYEALRLARIPAMAERRADIHRGAVLAFEVDRHAIRERLANQIASVLGGTPPGEIPVHSPRKFLLTVNTDACRRLGLDVPRTLLLQADHFIVDGR